MPRDARDWGEIMNRSDAVERMASRAHITKEQADAALTALLDGMDEMLKENGSATLAEFEEAVAKEEKSGEISGPEKKQIAGAHENESDGSWDRIWALAGSIEGPPDWAENHDHYLRLARKPLLK